jgi:hypothetical protein
MSGTVADRCADTDDAGLELASRYGETLNQQTALYEVLPAPSGPVVLPEEPADIAAAQRLFTGAEAALREAMSSVSARKRRAPRRVIRFGWVQQVVAGFARITDNQAVEDEQDAAGGSVVVAPYEGDPAGAWERHLELAKAVKERGKACVAADKLVNQLAEALRTTASDVRFHKLVSAARTQITSVPPSELPQHAGNWRTLLQPRLRGLSEDLAHSDRDRKTTVALFGEEDRLMSVLRTFRTPPPLLTEVVTEVVTQDDGSGFGRVGTGDLLLVLENSTTWWSIVNALPAPDEHRVGYIAWGLGGGFTRSVESIAERHRISEVRYFGDLDFSGCPHPVPGSGGGQKTGPARRGAGDPPLRRVARTRSSCARSRRSAVEEGASIPAVARAGASCAGRGPAVHGHPPRTGVGRHAPPEEHHRLACSGAGNGTGPGRRSWLVCRRARTRPG